MFRRQEADLAEVDWQTRMQRLPSLVRHLRHHPRWKTGRQWWWWSLWLWLLAFVLLSSCRSACRADWNRNQLPERRTWSPPSWARAAEATSLAALNGQTSSKKDKENCWLLLLTICFFCFRPSSIRRTTFERFVCSDRPIICYRPCCCAQWNGNPFLKAAAIFPS